MLAEITVKIMWAAARIGSSLGRKEFVRLSGLRFGTPEEIPTGTRGTLMLRPRTLAHQDHRGSRSAAPARASAGSTKPVDQDQLLDFDVPERVWNKNIRESSRIRSS